MTSLNPEKLHVRFQPDTTPDEFHLPRRYTLTHSDATGDLFLCIGSEFDYNQINNIYTRLMRDEVLAEWKNDNGELSFHIYCHVSGGLVFGSAGWRYSIFQHHLRQVLEALREGDDRLFYLHPELDKTIISVHFSSTSARYNRIEEHGVFEKYR